LLNVVSLSTKVPGALASKMIFKDLRLPTPVSVIIPELMVADADAVAIHCVPLIFARKFPVKALMFGISFWQDETANAAISIQVRILVVFISSR
jgi:hypothetical protein